MAQTRLEDTGRLVLRVTLGGLMLLHGISKLRHFETIPSLVKGHLPAFVGYGVLFGEVVAPILIIIGFATRWASAVFAFNMVVAVGLAHSSDVFKLGRSGGSAIELQLLYFFGAIAVLLLGPGELSVTKGKGRFG